jgi:hypothetical protein
MTKFRFSKISDNVEIARIQREIQDNFVAIDKDGNVVLSGNITAKDAHLDGDSLFLGKTRIRGPKAEEDNYVMVFDKTNNLITYEVKGDFSSFLDLTEISAPAAPGANILRLFVEDKEGFSFFKFIDSTGMKRALVRDSVFVAKNTRGSTIASGRIVYATGNVDDVPTIDTAKADSLTTMPAIGVTIESIADGAFGRVMQVGLLENVNTSAFNVGDVLYVSAATAGVPTVTPPAYPNVRQEIGTILADSATVGSIQIVARSILDETIIDHDGLLNFVANEHINIANFVCNDGDVITHDGEIVWVN